jgi:hypothetical protein
MSALSIIALILAIVSFGAVGLVLFFQNQIRQSVDHLLQEHPATTKTKEVEQRAEQEFQAIINAHKEKIGTRGVPFSQRMDIIGFVDQSFSVQNDQNGFQSFDAELIEIPAGTTQIIPCITEQVFHYGHATEQTDHHLYLLFGSVSVSIRDEVTANTVAFFQLTDSNFNNAWGAFMDVRFLCLAPHQ